jgi:hypothetical protein
MNILLGFAPYLAFFLFMQAVSIDLGLWAALIVAMLSPDLNMHVHSRRGAITAKGAADWRGANRLPASCDSDVQVGYGKAMRRVVAAPAAPG